MSLENLGGLVNVPQKNAAFIRFARRAPGDGWGSTGLIVGRDTAPAVRGGTKGSPCTLFAKKDSCSQQWTAIPTFASTQVKMLVLISVISRQDIYNIILYVVL